MCPECAFEHIQVKNFLGSLALAMRGGKKREGAKGSGWNGRGRGWEETGRERRRWEGTGGSEIVQDFLDRHNSRQHEKF